MTNHLPPELTGKYPKRYASRILDDNGHQLSFGIYRDRGKNRDKGTSEYPSNYLAPVLEWRTSKDVTPDINPFFVIDEERTDFGYQQLIWAYVDESTVDHTVDGYVYRHVPSKKSQPSVIVSQLTLFSGVEDNKVTVAANMVQQLIEKYYVPLTHDEQTRAYMNGDCPLPYHPLPVVGIGHSRYTEIAHIPSSAYRFDTSEKGSFRDNLR